MERPTGGNIYSAVEVDAGVELRKLQKSSEFGH